MPRITDIGDTIKYNGPTSFCEGKSLELTANNAPNTATFQWKKDGVDIQGATSASYTATESGSYTVVVSDNSGTSNTYPALLITVRSHPVSGFTFSPNGGCSNIPIHFTNTSTGTGLTYTWTFGDINSGGNNTSNAIHPDHTFIGIPGNNTQSFAVKLVADNAGCKDSITKTITTSQVPGTELGGTGAVNYNGLHYFTSCASTTSLFTFSNQSSTSYPGNTNTSYIIKWGDGTADFSTTSFASTTHTYGIGNYHLQFIVTGQNGCIDTGDYYVFVGNNPAVGFGNPGNTFICTQTPLTFPITGTDNNPPGTTYTFQFNDGSPNVIYTHPAPASITHLFEKGSCGTNSGSSPNFFPNSFQATVQASNPCGTSAAIVVPIYVSEKSKAVIGYSPDTVICVNNTLTVTNLGGNGYGITGSANNAVCTPGKGIWSISPSTGWSLRSGSFGNDFGSTDPALWTNGSTSLAINFSIPGTYTIKLKTSGSQLCGGETVTRTICVNPAPTAAFTLSANQGCGPLTVTTTNNSNQPLCKTNTYQWSVSYSNTSGCTPNTSGYSYINGTSETSEAPQFQFTNPGVYTISLVTKNSGGLCTSAAVSQTVTVKAKPIVTVSVPASVCQNGSINPTSTVKDCYSSTPATYLWNFEGGSPTTSITANPGPITYSSSGSYNITLTVTNECGSTVINKTIDVTVAPDVTVPSDQVFCAGTATGGFNFTSTVANTTYSWTNSNNTVGLPLNGNGNIANFTAMNSGATPLIATITVTPATGCPGISKSFKITVNPRPAPPGVSGPYTYCLNEIAAQLTANGTSGNTLIWFDNAGLTGGSAIAPTPNTSAAGTIVYYVSQVNTYSCQGTPATIAITVNPKISGNSIGSDQTICTNTSPASLKGQTNLIGGNNGFSYQWQQSSDGGQTWTNITAATIASLSPGNLSSTTQYRRVVNSGACSDTSNAITITVQGTLSNIDIAGNQTICAGSTPALITGQIPAGGNGSFAYQWESSSNGTAWSVINGETGADYQPPSLTTSIYYRRLTKSGPCSGYSTSVLITVNPIPVVSTIQDKVYCNGSSVTGINFTATPGTGITYSWTNDNTQIGLAASGSGTISSFTTTNNLKEPILATIAVTPTYTNAGKSCTGSAGKFKVIVLPTITVSPINNETICTGVSIPSFTPVNDANNYPGSSVSYGWAVSGSGITLTNGSGISIPQFKGVNNGTTDLVATITVTPKYTYGGLTCDGTPTTYSITVKPGTPAADAGPDAVLCAADTHTMKANQPSSATGAWTQIGSTTASITNPGSATTTITGLATGNSYKFEWSLSGFASCPDTKDTVVITIDPDIVNTIATSTQTTCFGGQIMVNGDLPTGGNGTYSYQWQQSTDNSNWTNIPGATGISLTFIPAQTVYVKRLVTSLPCKNESPPAQIIVQPGISNNNISQDQSICINTLSSTITGALPSGGNGLYSYQWEQSTNGGSMWSSIPGATGQDYSPGILTTTTKYRRLVSTNLCSGPQANTSNIVTVTVNPNAKAVFNPTISIGCIPFKITPAIINLQTYPLQNSQYNWYVNDVLIGTGSTFPGYIMNKDNDTITIKLVAVSAFGCVNDTLSHTFYTYETPQPSFTLSDIEGCGPLAVQINNTTPNLNTFSYQWNFGNGQTSNLAQPGQIKFLPNPNYGDTTYQIELSVASACNTLGASQSVKVKSKPKALFAPDKSVGCSPMTVSFNNTSLGVGNSYIWDFGDGSSQVNTTNPNAVNHTFTTGVQDTFHVRLIAINECGNDTLKYAIVVSPNKIRLDFAINGNQFSGCSPHTVQFVNNSSGATLFSWSFGDNNNINTTRNIDTVSHTYFAAGNYTVTLKATNGCSDTTSTETIVVFAKPKAKFAAVPITACIGDSIHFTNQSSGATSYLWKLGDGNTLTLTSPVYKYATPGNYTVDLIASSFNAPNTVCSDTVSQPIQIVSSMRGTIMTSDTVGYCAPFTVTFDNLNLPSTTAVWNFGDGGIGNGNTVSHTYTTAGTYQVTLDVTVPGGCNYITKKTVKVSGPSGSWTHTTGYLCNDAAAYFQVVANNADSLIYQFGDGTVFTTTSNTVSHVYANGGTYLPSVILKNKAGCLVPLQGIDSIKVDKVKAGFKAAIQQYCGYTVVNFTDTTHAYFGKSKIEWVFGDGTTSTGGSATHTYNTTGNYPVKLIITGNSGCSDTLSKLLTVIVYSKPKATIVAEPIVCARYPVLLGSSIQSGDAINVAQWTLSNGVTNANQSFNYSFNQAGNYNMQLIVGTVNGCYDTVSSFIKVNPTPNITASADLNICRGSSASISVNGTGVNEWNWFPQAGLSCTTCTNLVASPLITTPYVIEGKNNFGCSAYDTVVVTVIQPLHMKVSSSDSICIGESTNLLASGAGAYSWSPALGLNNTSISNPTAAPTVTTSYRVVGYDGYNCFTDTAYVIVAVGQYPTVNLGPDLTLAAGTLQPLSSTVQNGPIRNWSWTPSTNLSCTNCSLPIATIKKNISYVVKVTTAYGCSATDTIRIKVFCEDTQTFIPNAFTPDGDGINDILMVRGKGVVMVKSFRIYNRWGQIVFEKTDFAPNDPSYGWNGKINGVVGGPDVYVYTAEVVCENGATFTYKGNVSLIK